MRRRPASGTRAACRRDAASAQWRAAFGRLPGRGRRLRSACPARYPARGRPATASKAATVEERGRRPRPPPALPARVAQPEAATPRVPPGRRAGTRPWPRRRPATGPAGPTSSAASRACVIGQHAPLESERPHLPQSRTAQSSAATRNAAAAGSATSTAAGAGARAPPTRAARKAPHGEQRRHR